MRLVKLLVDESHRGPVLSVLEEEGIDYLLIGSVSSGAEALNEELLVEFPLPAATDISRQPRPHGFGKPVLCGCWTA